MEKKAFQTLFKVYMKGLGFRAKGNTCFKAVSEDYMLVVYIWNAVPSGVHTGSATVPFTSRI